MRDQITALKELQNIDIDLKKIETNLKKFPNKISEYNTEINKYKELITNEKSILSELEITKSSLESELEENELSIKKAEEKLFEIKTHKEYEALQKEIAEMKRINSELEEHILLKLEDIENNEKKITEEEEKLNSKETEYAQKIEEYQIQIEELKVIHEPKIAEKNKILERINTEVLPIYENIINKNGQALALVVNEVCTGCNMNIPPQLYNHVLTQEEIYQCPSCKRILYTSPGE